MSALLSWIINYSPYPDKKAINDEIKFIISELNYKFHYLLI